VSACQPKEVESPDLLRRPLPLPCPQRGHPDRSGGTSPSLLLFSVAIGVIPNLVARFWRTLARDPLLPFRARHSPLATRHCLLPYRLM
jgi:hypothetical protein